MRKSFLVLILAAAVLAGCGGGGSSAKLGAGDVSVVGKEHITKTQLDALLAEAKVSYTQQGRKFPQQGTQDYQTLQGEALTLLVEQAERDQKATQMGITVSQGAIANRLKQIKQQPYFGGSEKKYRAQLKKAHLTDAEIRDDVRAMLTSEAIYKKITSSVTVSDKEIHDYYEAHQSQYLQPASRDVRYILVGKSKTQAEAVYKQLKNGNEKTWCTLAKRYAKDTSAQSCGKATFTKGETVKVFDKTAFSAPTGKVVAPFYDPTQYKAWFVIEPLTPVRQAATTPEKQVAAAIRQSLLSDKQKQAVNDWLANLKHEFCSGSEIKYQVGYSPSPDPCAATTTSPTTTG
jgi:hypothetical protein